MIYAPDEYLKQPLQIRKAAYLAKLYAAGYNVPKFVVLSETTFTDCSATAEQIITRIPVLLYAVRFASQSEDGEYSSEAGKYTSQLAVTPTNLAKAITMVVQESLMRSLSTATYVVIVQEYITSDSSGVAFTRHPDSITASCVEYGSGSGAVVAGTTGTHIDITAETVVATLPKQVQLLLPIMKSIESLFEFPQDIEWCYAKDTLYIVQSRPITSYTKEQWAARPYIEAVVAHKEHYTLKSDSSVESYVYPTPLDLSILEAIYKQDGAVATAYRRFELQYTATNHFILIGNRLYVDTLLEQQCLFPSYRPGTNGSLSIKVFPFHDFIITSKNRALTARKNGKKQIESIVADLFDVLAKPVPRIENNLYSYLTTHYAVIYCINVLIRSSDSFTLSDTQKKHLDEIKLPPDVLQGTVRGNSLALADTSRFTTITKFENKNYVDTLRELARIQTVRLRTAIEAYLVTCVKECHISPELMSYCTIAELETKVATTSQAEGRKLLYNNMSDCSFPEFIASYIPKRNEKIVILSTGTAEGTLCTPETVSSTAGNKILYVSILSPDVVQYFAQVQGVICNQGGLLSHAAIIARELKLPVVQSSLFIYAENTTVELPKVLAKND